jgi:hypothetical protein
MFLATGPVTSKTSAWRGEATKRSPKRSMVERVNFQFAAVARAGVHLPDGETAAQTPARGRAQALGQGGKVGVIGRRRRLGERKLDETFEQQLAHGRS